VCERVNNNAYPVYAGDRINPDGTVEGMTEEKIQERIAESESKRKRRMNVIADGIQYWNKRTQEIETQLKKVEEMKHGIDEDGDLTTEDKSVVLQSHNETVEALFMELQHTKRLLTHWQTQLGKPSMPFQPRMYNWPDQKEEEKKSEHKRVVILRIDANRSHAQDLVLVSHVTSGLDGIVYEPDEDEESEFSVYSTSDEFLDEWREEGECVIILAATKEQIQSVKSKAKGVPHYVEGDDDALAIGPLPVAKFTELGTDELQLYQ
jgi:peptidyl-tRNA hydrolase